MRGVERAGGRDIGTGPVSDVSPVRRRLVDRRTLGWCLLLTAAMFGALACHIAAVVVPIAFFSHADAELLAAGRRLLSLSKGGLVASLLLCAYAAWAMWRRMSRRWIAAGPTPAGIRPGLRVLPAVVLAALLCFVAAWALHIAVPALLHGYIMAD